MIDANKIKLSKLPRPEKNSMSGLIYNKRITNGDYEKLRSNVLTALAEDIKPAQISEWLEFTKYPLSETSIRSLGHKAGGWSHLRNYPPRYWYIEDVWSGEDYPSKWKKYHDNWDAIKLWT